MNIKNFKWKKGYWWYVGGATIGTFLTVHAIRQYNLLEKTTFTASGFVPNTINFNEADFNIKYKMTNPSAVDYYLYNQVYNLYLNDQFVAVIRNPNKIYVAPERTTDVWLNVKFNPQNIKNLSWQQIMGLLLKSSTTPIQLKGNAKVKALNGLASFNYPVDETFTLKDLKS